jgi:hypothetical protein
VIAPQLVLELLDRRLVHLAARGEAADQVDDRLQWPVGVRGGQVDHRADTRGVEQVGLDELETVLCGDRVPLAGHDPGHHHAPTGVQEPRRHRAAQTARTSGDHCCCRHPRPLSPLLGPLAGPAVLDV